MTADELRQRLATLADAWVHDEEESHLAEDLLAIEVLEHVAEGHPQSRALARMMADAMRVDRWRWYA